MCIPAHNHNSNVVMFPQADPRPSDSADCCVECGRLIASARQISQPGTDVCDRCASGPEAA